ncbi:uncharacterized protein [Rutidosis leptorrhynchoides]|uniref:uncharacterized protein n=1 Tax=Rutidosis leptorrhynchoides TaxID=125765 RepID=UPI003A9A613F
MRNLVRKHIFHEIGNGKDTSFWYDNWHPIGPLISVVNAKDIVDSSLSKGCTVSDLVRNGTWVWPFNLMVKDDVEITSFNPVLQDDKLDVVKWRCNDGQLKDFSVSNVWLDLRDAKPIVSWHKAVWFTQNIPRHAFMLWLAINERLSTQDRLEQWGLQQNQVCPLCSMVRDSHSHLFVHCSYVQKVWVDFKGKAKMDDLIDAILSGNHRWPDIVNLVATQKCNKSIWSIIRRLVFGAVIYMIWGERNARIYQDKKRSEDVLIKAIFDVVRLKLFGLKIHYSKQSQSTTVIWGFSLLKGNSVLLDSLPNDLHRN